MRLITRSTRDQLFQIVYHVRHGHGGGKFTNPAPYCRQIELRVGGQQTFDILQVFRTPRDGLHDDEVFDPWQSDLKSGNVVDLTSIDGLTFELQAPEHDVDIDTGALMPKQEHPRPPGEFQGALDSRNDTESRRVGKGAPPVRFWDHCDRIDILGEPRPSKK